MMTIMLDLCFQSLLVVKNLKRHKNAIQLTFEYHVKVVIPLSMVCFDKLNPIANAFDITTIDVVGMDLDENMFGVRVSIKESL